MIYSKNFSSLCPDSFTDSWLRQTYKLVCEPGHCWKIVSHKYICLAFIQVCVGSPNKLNPQNHLFFGQFSLSIDIYVQTYFNLYFVLALASFADTPCYALNLFQGLFVFFAGCPTQSYVKNKDIYFRETKLQQFRGSKSILNTILHCIIVCDMIYTIQRGRWVNECTI